MNCPHLRQLIAYKVPMDSENHMPQEKPKTPLGRKLGHAFYILLLVVFFAMAVRLYISLNK